MTMGQYDSAQICFEGHITNSLSKSNPQCNRRHCDMCGAETITTCQNCDQSIRGGFTYYKYRRIHASVITEPPMFREHCGKPYPWSAARLEAARQLVEEMGILDIPDKTLLNECIEDLIHNTPRAPAAAVRFRSLASKGGPVILEAFRQILYNVMSEPLRKMIWPAG